MITRYWSVFFIILPLSMLIGSFLAASVSMMMPKRYESTAIVEIVRAKKSMEVAAEIKRLTDSKHLALASHHLDLINRWGVDHPKAVQMLADSVIVEQVPGGRLIRIRATSIYREDARDIVNALIFASRSIHEGYDLETIKQTLNALEKEIMNQEYLVYKLDQEMRDNATLMRDPLTGTATELKTRYEEEFMRLSGMRARSNTHPFPALEDSQGGVLIHKSPVIAEFPYTPDAYFIQIIGTLSGLLLGIPTALGIMAFIHKRHPTETLASLITRVTAKRTPPSPPDY